MGRSEDRLAAAKAELIRAIRYAEDDGVSARTIKQLNSIASKIESLQMKLIEKRKNT